MKEHTTSILRESAILFCAVILLLGQAKKSSAVVVRADIIRAAVVDTLNAQAERNGLDIEVSVPSVSNVIVNDVGIPRLRVIIPSPKKVSSSVRAKVEFIDGEGETARQITVFARIKSFAAVAITTGDISRGDTIGQDDVALRKMNVSGYKDYFVSLSELAGKQAKRKIKAGTVLTGKNVEPIPVIRRGDRVVMKAFIGNVVITAKGTARENGGLNESIRIYNDTTRKTIICTVIDSRTVLVSGEGG